MTRALVLAIVAATALLFTAAADAQPPNLTCTTASGNTRLVPVNERALIRALEAKGYTCAKA